MSYYNNNNTIKNIIENRYNKKSIKKNIKTNKINNYDIKLLNSSFLKMIAIIYLIIAIKYIASTTGVINIKKIILSIFRLEFALFSSSISNTVFFNSII
ncbi:hypothetical protein IOLA_132 [uncultured bacterium]|nr:hypothetical protein IOLA_132 [uncultured bacterium]